MRAFGVLAVGLAALFASRTAGAFERQQHAGLDLGPSLMTTSGTSKIGLDLGLHYTYGATDALNLVAEAGWATFASSGATGPQPSNVLHGGAGVVYVFDVLRWVPYAGALVGASYLGGGATPKSIAAADGQLAVGLDYAFSREWTVGAAYRQHILLGKTSDYSFWGVAAVRVEYVWGW
jgi:hypothetical protein